MDQKIDKCFLSIIKYSAYQPTDTNERAYWEVYKQKDCIEEEENENFNALKTIIEENSAYQDKSAKIDINENRIDFKISLSEIENIFSKKISRFLEQKKFLT